MTDFRIGLNLYEIATWEEAEMLEVSAMNFRTNMKKNGIM
jgi:hypothetical protein